MNYHLYILYTYMYNISAIGLRICMYVNFFNAKLPSSRLTAMCRFVTSSMMSKCFLVCMHIFFQDALLKQSVSNYLDGIDYRTIGIHNFSFINNFFYQFTG